MKLLIVTLSSICLLACGAKKNVCDGPCPATNIDHLVVVVQENHTFDSYFARYCTAPTGSNPTCNDGPSCCETGPDSCPGADGGLAPVVLTDETNGNFDRDHYQACEESEIDDGGMDGFCTSVLDGQPCGDPRNFAYAEGPDVQPYWTLAQQNALADRYFQPVAGESNANDAYLASARYEFKDDDYMPDSDGSICSLDGAVEKHLTDKNIGDLLVAQGISWAWYAEGYSETVTYQQQNPPACPPAPSGCSFGVPTYPCVYDPGDVPLEYYEPYTDNPKYMKDFTSFETDVKAGNLPQVVFVKPFGFRSEHPGYGDTISAGASFVSSVAREIADSSYSDRTLVLVTWDEGGGFFDHIAPPPTSTIDNEPYGTRIPLLAVGHFARKNFVSHVTMEHSSILKFIEWNWLGKQTGQLGNRDAEVNNIGSLLDSDQTGLTVPAQ